MLRLELLLIAGILSNLKSLQGFGGLILGTRVSSIAGSDSYLGDMLSSDGQLSEPELLAWTESSIVKSLSSPVIAFLLTVLLSFLRKPLDVFSWG